MHICDFPSSFFTNNIGNPHELELVQIKPLLKRSSICLACSFACVWNWVCSLVSCFCILYIVSTITTLEQPSGASGIRPERTVYRPVYSVIESIELSNYLLTLHTICGLDNRHGSIGSLEPSRTAQALLSRTRFLRSLVRLQCRVRVYVTL